ncbi:nucleotide exchange factor GrpE [Sphingomicrobium astaxanthinifaciens]|uniref:nucleotide exchange factor GrpE n=1 Tax=Sphingomicrobium astaxanthinifaciens TaxID=1227949 RepID=UPI001FCB2110|nr:nucleotide exchange factor GrpE [Sphingomicrobium astaxanthinifaciens]MCJ7422011.1 nucleotide exchange factor GrpE [Sphingomicrobium astaxanthinifaciens]
MTEENHTEAEELREETAEESPELQEHDRLATLEAELEETKQKALYAAAEVQNVRRRLEQEKQDATKFAVSNFARDMLSVKDHLERALDHVPDEAREGRAAKFIEGIEATLREMDAIFTRQGIERIAAKGLELDPNVHQAMIEIPSDEAEPGTIVEEMQPGYTLKGRLLRPAMVGVAKKP